MRANLEGDAFWKENKKERNKNRSLYLSVRVFSTVVLTVDTVNKQINITNRTEIC